MTRLISVIFASSIIISGCMSANAAKWKHNQHNINEYKAAEIDEYCARNGFVRDTQQWLAASKKCHREHMLEAY